MILKKAESNNYWLLELIGKAQTQLERKEGIFELREIHNKKAD